MKINAKVHILLLLGVSLLGLMIVFLTSNDLASMLTEQGFHEEAILRIIEKDFSFSFILPFLLSGAANGYYLYIAYKKANPGSIGLAIFLGFILWPLIGFVGVFSVIPMFIISIYQWLIAKHKVYQISRHGIQAAVIDSPYSDLVDETCRDYLQQFLKKRGRIKFLTVILLIIFNIFITISLGETTITSRSYNISISGLPALFDILIIILSILLYMIIMNLVDTKLLKPIIALLFDSCDPYRTTQILDYKKIVLGIGQHYLLYSLNEEHNISRVKQVLIASAKSKVKTNLHVVAAFSILSEEEKRNAVEQYHHDNIAILETSLKKYPKNEENIKSAIQFCNAVLMLYCKEYDKALSELETKYTITPLAIVHNVYLKGQILWEKDEKEKALELFKIVIDTGNTLAIVEKSRDYIHKYQSLKEEGQQLSMF